MEKNKKRHFTKYLPAIVFLAFIFGMGIWFLFGSKSNYSSSEKRYLQQFPEVTAESISNGEFSKKFESYFADQFPERKLWVGMNAYYNLDIGNNGSSGVYNCKDGYLINVPVSKDNRINKNIGVVADFAKSVDVPVTVMFAPSTGYVADDVLPAVHNSYNDDIYFESISKKLEQDNINFVDLRKTFKDEYKKGNQLYYKTDHHWTTLGAYTAYTQLCGSLNITPAQKDMFKVETYDNFYGTTYSTSGFWLTPPDKIELWKNPDNTEENINVKVADGDKVKESGSLFFEEHLKEDDKYPVFIDGNHAVSEITNKNAKGGTLVMIKDSFAHSMAPFLAENYSRIVMVDMRYYKQSVSQLVKDEKADNVIVLYGIDNFATDTDIVWLK